MYCEELRISDCGFRIANARRLRARRGRSGASSIDNRQSEIANRTAFSLVEIMIVIVIIGLLAGVVTINVRSYLTKAKQNVAKNGIATIVKALEMFWGEHDRYPTNEEGLEILTRPSEKSSEPLLHKGLKDPWGRPFQYNSPGSNGPYEVISLGADGREGGEGADADVTSDELQE